MQNSILSQDELDFLLTGAVREASGQAAEQVLPAGTSPAEPSAPPAGQAPGRASASDFFPAEARLRFARLLQDDLGEDGEEACLVRPEEDGAAPAAWRPCAGLACEIGGGEQGEGTAGTGAGSAGGNASRSLLAGFRLDGPLARAILARQLGAASYEPAAGFPTRLEQALLRHALRALPACLARALAPGKGRSFRLLGAAGGQAEAGQAPAAFGFAVRLGSLAGRLRIELD